MLTYVLMWCSCSVTWILVLFSLALGEPKKYFSGFQIISLEYVEENKIGLIYESTGDM